MDSINKNKPAHNKNSSDLKKLILQLHAKIDLIKGCVMRLEQKIRDKVN